MANGKAKPGWTPANEAEATKAGAGEVYQGQDGEYYQHENMPKASPKNPPAPATSKAPSADDLDAVAEEETVKAATAPPVQTSANPPAPAREPSFRKGVSGAPTNPDFDQDKFDSTGKNVKSGSIPGPQGADKPPDVMTDEERAAVAKKQEAKLASGIASTHGVDSVGKLKGSFEVTPQGNDKNGAKIPDKVDYAKPVTPVAAQVGPRGQGAPKDTYHRK